MSVMKEFEQLKIRLEDIKCATNNFGDKQIGHGGFGPVYKGELSLPEGPTMVAFKRLDRKHGQGDNEFWKEIMMLSECRHENLVSLMHFCNEGAEKILVYEYASRGSLDRYLSDTSLTWTQRLKICIGAARGLNYLHDPMGTQQRVLHRDIKSSNILLDEKWTAKVSDFGLSKIGPANQQHTYLISNVVGTPGYCDPLYWEMGFLSKESDVYSFGVVLFEVMCGRLCYEYRNGELSRILVPMWKKFYDEKRLNEIIIHDLKEQIDLDSLNTFSSIAYQCLERTREERPTMAEIIKELEVALEQQEIYEDVEERIKFQERIKIADLAVPPLSYRSRSELYFLLSKGIIVEGGKTWLSINENDKTCEMVSATKCILYENSLNFLSTSPHSRFSNVQSFDLLDDFKVEASTKFLSPHVTYTVNLVFQHQHFDLGPHVPFKYKLNEETEYWTSCIAHEREDGWLMTELYQFTSYQKEHDFGIMFKRPSTRSLHYDLILEGVEFRPVEYEKHDNLENKDKMHVQPLSDLDTDVEEQLKFGYTEIINRSEHILQWTTKKELHFLLRKGFLIDDGEKWFFVNKDLKKCHMLLARRILVKEWNWKSLPDSRFDAVAEACDINSFCIHFSLFPKLFSCHSTYAVYLVYKPPENHSTLQSVVEIENKYPWYRETFDTKNVFHLSQVRSKARYMYLRTPPHTPIIRAKADEKSHNSSRTRKIKGHPKLRKDGWMEYQVSEYRCDLIGKLNRIIISFNSVDEWNFTGLLVQGVEFRPL